MRKKTSREERESSLASGWTVSGDEPAGDPGTEAIDAAGVDGGAVASETVSGSGAAGAETDTSDDSDVSGGADTDTDADTAVTEQLSNGALVLMGILGGLFLLYSWIWLSWAQFYAEMNAALAAGSGSLGSALQQALFWAAPAAPALWFIATLRLCKGAGTRRTIVWLIIGAIVLLPYPIFSGGGAS